jgi:diguanylate cyclase (GGDEF)-like protein
MLAAALLVLLGAHYVAYRLTIIPRFEAIERDDARRNLERALSALDAEVTHLDVLAHDYAAWDDTVAFLDGKAPAYEAANLGEDTFSNNRVDVAQIVAADGRVVWQMARDPETATVSLPRGLPVDRYPPGHPFIAHGESRAPIVDRSVRGAVLLGAVPYLIASRPVVRSDNSGPIVGTLLFGRRLSAEFVERLAEQTRMELHVLRIDEPAARASVRRLQRDANHGEPIRIDVVSKGRVRVTSLYRGIDGNAVLLVATQLPRAITIHGESTLWSALLWTLLSGLATLALVMFGLRRAVLRPVAKLRRHTRDVERTGDLSLRLLLPGTDEVAELAHAFDGMLISLAAARAELEREARVDGLTGVANRRSFDEALDLEWRRMGRAGQPLAVIMGDIDFFKAFNDTYGHPAGDECLRLIGGVLQSQARRAGDLVARYGGEEFVILLPDTSSEGALCVANGIGAALVAAAIPHAGSAVAPVVTLSMGVASLQADPGGPPAVLVQRADAALYAAKRAGRNRAIVADEGLTRPDTLPAPQAA